LEFLFPDELERKFSRREITLSNRSSKILKRLIRESRLTGVVVPVVLVAVLVAVVVVPVSPPVLVVVPVVLVAVDIPVSSGGVVVAVVVPDSVEVLVVLVTSVVVVVLVDWAGGVSAGVIGGFVTGLSIAIPPPCSSGCGVMLSGSAVCAKIKDPVEKKRRNVKTVSMPINFFIDFSIMG